jgi:mannose-6-phosphate isomerase-like protein (cupin superfamily)
MKLIKREDVPKKPLPGRVLQLLVGQEGSISPSSMMTMGFARYSAEAGPMAPHHHAEEIVYVLESDRGWTRYGGTGDEPDELGEPVPLEPGMALHFPESEWHVFESEEGGHVEIIFFYSQSDVYSKK